MNCIDFRRLAQADPHNRGVDFAAHRLSCTACQGMLQEQLRFDQQLRGAMQIDVPQNLGARAMFAAAGQKRRSRGWSLAAAASVIALLGGAMWFAATPQQKLGEELMAHIYHEPQLLMPSDAMAPEAELATVLRRSRAILSGDIGTVTYAGLCPFRGNLVAHLVVRGERGPVTVLLLPDEHVDGPVVIDEDGFRGTILPSGPGSIAVIGVDDEIMPALENRVFEAVEWSI